jgi:hypothetical protein
MAKQIQRRPQNHPSELDIIEQCLAATLDGPFFPSGEFATITGVSLEEIHAVAQQWPEYNKNMELHVVASVCAVLKAFLWYPGRIDIDQAWPRHFDFHPDRLKPVAAKWHKRLDQLRETAGLSHQ